ncbi:MAG: hypothetical protein H6981_02900 [Gammaproteobacteria bacterium]|nr:hypothetical protein [Gammaproteobacteria bacterium]MCP5135737.1 hypothetical protein [Gammaproteobacteria bacterium]
MNIDDFLAFLSRIGHRIAGFMAEYGTWLLVAVILLLTVLAVIYLRRSKSRWLQLGPKRLGTWSLNLMRGLRYLSTRREWRYHTPWVLIAGDADSGKSSITQSIQTCRRSALLLREAHLAVADSEWGFFDGGVVIDIHALDDPDPEKVRDHWHKVLADIDAQRPERPLDAIVLTLSAQALLTPPSGGLQALAERSYQQLFTLQKRFSFTFPVYVLVTHCDEVDGFDAFWQAQPDARRREILGWSNPFSLNHRFDPDWVDEAFKQMREDLHAAQLDAAAHADIADPDAFFLFPQRFEALRAPLRTVLEQVFRSAAYHEDFLVRGLYFAGRVETTEVDPEKPLDDVAFVDDLFNQRVFRERNLARPTVTGVLSRNTLIRRFQIGMLAAVVGLMVILTLNAMRLDNQIDAAISGFNVIQNADQVLDSEGGTCDRGHVDVIYDLLTNLAQMDMDWTYLFIPASWFDDGVANGAAQHIANRVFKEIVFPSVRCRLETRAQELVTGDLGTVPDNQDPAAEVTQARTLASEYLQAVIDLQNAMRTYVFLTTSSSGNSTALQTEMLRQFNTLATYAYGKPLPEIVQRRRGQQLRALGFITVTDMPAQPKNFRKRVSERLDEYLVQARQVIRTRVGEGETLARAIETDDRHVDLNQVANWLEFAHRDWLSTDGDNNPCALVVSAMEPGIKDLNGNFGYPAELIDSLDRFRRNDAANPESKGCFVDSLDAIEATSIAPYGSITQRVSRSGKGGKPYTIRVLAPWVSDELAGLQAVRDQRFMSAPSGAGFRCAAPLRGWDGARLAEAVSYTHDYQAFREQHQLPPPQTVDADKKPLYDRLARRQLKAVLDELANRAQQPLSLADTAASLWLSPLSTGDERLGTRSRAFALTAPPLQQVLALYAQFGMDSQGILACARGFANGELDAANRLAEASGLYEPETDASALNPQNGAHLNYFDLGTPADTKEYLHQQLQRAQVLAGYAEPFVRFLQNTDQPTVNGPDNRQGVTFWLATINEIDRFIQGKDPKSQVAQLNDFVQKDLREMSQSNCADTLMKPVSADDDPSQGKGLFSDRRSSLGAQSADYCTSGNKVLARGDYRALAKRFNSELAGLFPFGPASNGDAPLAAVKRFFLDYAGQREGLRKKVETAGNTKRWQKVAEFLDQLDATADFLNASLAAGVKSQPLGLEVGFRYLPTDANPALGGSSQLIAWEFEAGDNVARYPNGDTALNWQFGQPVTLTLQWAGLSAYRPRSDDTQQHLDVDDRTASFSAKGAWALLRLIDAHRDTTPGVADPLNDTRVITAFDIPLKLQQPPGTDKNKHAKLRLALDLVASGADGKPGAPLDLPVQFPNKAPYVW